MRGRVHGKAGREIVAAVLACLAAWLVPIAAGATAPDAPPTLGLTLAGLGTVPARPASAEPFRLAPDPAGDRFAQRWREVSAGIAADRAVLAACRVAPAGCPEAARRFQAVVALAEAGTGRARLGVLNRAINLAIAYTSDLVQHGREDVWSAPLATFASGMGDCEDYAIAKYVALLEAGVAEEDLRIVIVDERWSGLHAVASVRSGDAWLVLDNRRMALIEDRDLAAYRAVATFDRRAPAAVVAAASPGAQVPAGAFEPAS